MRNFGAFGLGMALILVGLNCRERNRAPDVPPAPVGPMWGMPDSVHTFVVTACDPDGDSVALLMSWGDSSVSAWTASVPSGETCVVHKSWVDTGQYVVRARARDVHGVLSDWSGELTVQISESAPPLAPPAVVKGPVSAEVDFIIDGFTCVMNGPAGESLALDFDWGQGNTERNAAFGRSGNRIATRHVFWTPGICSVRARVRSIESGRYSEWSMAHPVTVTRTLGDGWERGYESDNMFYGLARAIDGGLVLCGGNEGVSCIIRTDEEGNLIWCREFNGPTLASIRPTVSGGYISAGFYGPGEGWWANVGAARMDADGNAVWTRQYTDDYGHVAYCALPTSDGGAIIGSHDLALKVDSAGDTVWFGRNLPALWVGQGANGHCLCYGSRGDSQIETEVDRDGQVVGRRLLFTRTGEECVTPRRAADGSIFLSRAFLGSTCSTCVTKLSSDGRQLWNRCLTGISGFWVHDLASANDGGRYVVGEPLSGDCDLTLLARLDAVGVPVWKLATDLSCDGGFGYSLLTDFDGGCIVQPVRAGPVNLRKYDASGHWTPDSTARARFTSKHARRPVSTPKNLLDRVGFLRR